MAAALVVAIAAAVLACSGGSRPIKRGTSIGFWNNGLGINLGDRRESLGGVYPPSHGWYFYYIQGFHGQELFWIPADEARADFPRALKKTQTEPKTMRRYVLEGHRAWVEKGGKTADEFLTCARSALLKQAREQEEPLDNFLLEEERDFELRRKKDGRYWLNVLFEAAHLGALAVFALWPWLRGLRGWRWALHLGLLPFLFFLPFFLGYCPLTFTSAGEVGGAVYQYLLHYASIGSAWPSADRGLQRLFPNLLESLSLTPGSMLSISGMSYSGPFTLLLLGAVIAAVVLLAQQLWSRCRRRFKIAEPAR